MGTWNYRVIALRTEEEDFFQIHEVHYDDGGQIKNWTVDPVNVCGNDADGLRWTLAKMLEAVDEPWLIDQDGKLAPYAPRDGSV